MNYYRTHHPTDDRRVLYTVQAQLLRLLLLLPQLIDILYFEVVFGLPCGHKTGSNKSRGDALPKGSSVLQRDVFAGPPTAVSIKDPGRNRLEEELSIRERGICVGSE